MSIEAADRLADRIACPECGDDMLCLINGYLITPDAMMKALFGDRVLYEEPVERCLHRYLSDYQICDDCGAEQRWVVQIYPEVKP